MNTTRIKLSSIATLPMLALVAIITLPSVAAAQASQSCGCPSGSCQQCQPTTCTGCATGCSSCRSIRPRRGNGLSRMRTRPCPECDSCVLSLDEVEVKKTCFKTEQKEICIPKVRLPWQKCCPPGTSKSIVVTVLKKHSYKCKKCSYKWSVNEPSYGEAEKTTPAEIIYQPVYQAAPSPIQAEAPTVLPYETSTPMVEGTLSTGANR